VADVPDLIDEPGRCWSQFADGGNREMQMALELNIDQRLQENGRGGVGECRMPKSAGNNSDSHAGTHELKYELPRVGFAHDESANALSGERRVIEKSRSPGRRNFHESLVFEL
jgi:hypothetical protein